MRNIEMKNTIIDALAISDRSNISRYITKILCLCLSEKTLIVTKLLRESETVI